MAEAADDSADLIRIASDTLSAAINPLGAELWSLRDAEGRELMTDADPAFWTGHAPILFPVVGAPVSRDDPRRRDRIPDEAARLRHGDRASPSSRRRQIA